ncbi:MAG TPA: glycosyltransferase [Nocardioides sp.]|uniref:glycosyltransferase n=1 Tax=Nocardioides sp. TaxID=35761 RepID=UPI002D7E50B8|nr:glycosyltransferase [Nocardioides sp.]HET6653613.1 glycosyltransferase [Nocardioides sp.]
MRVLVATTAGAGHFAPLVPFAAACVAAGHEVRVAAPESFRDTVERAGLELSPVADAPPEALGAVMGRVPALTMREANEVVVREVFGRVDAESALPAMRAIFEAWRPDVVLREPGELSSFVVATRLGIPSVEVNPGLDRFVDDFVSLLDEPLRALGCESGSAGLRDATRWTLLPRSFDVDATVTAGEPRRFRYAAPEQHASEPLPAWWANHDDPLVYVTFGSVAAAIGLFPVFYASVLEALREVPARVLMTLGEAGDPAALGALPGNVHVEQWWPQDRVMPHAGAILGHGGFGTTMTALAAGLPQVVVPLFAGDQFENASRVDAVGAGVALQVDGVADRRAGDMVPAGPAVLDRLPEAVLAALRDERIRRSARAVADEIAALPDPASGVPLLEELVATR